MGPIECKFPGFLWGWRVYGGIESVLLGFCLGVVWVPIASRIRESLEIRRIMRKL